MHASSHSMVTAPTIRRFPAGVSWITFSFPGRDRDPAAVSRRARRRPGRFQFGNLFIAEYPAARQKPDAFRSFHGKSRTASGHHVDDELGVLPVFELRGSDIEFAAGNFAHQ